MTSADQRARIGFESWMGSEPDAVVDIGPSPFDQGRVNVLLFSGEEDEDDEDEDEFPLHYLTTAGMSGGAIAAGSASVCAELVLCVKAPFDLDLLEPLAKRLGAFALDLMQGRAQAAPGELIEIGPLPVFDGMTHVLVTSWGADEPELLRGVELPIHLWCLNALYPLEAEALRGLDEQGAMALLDEHEIDVDDPWRASMAGDEAAPMTSFDLAQGIQSMVGDLVQMAADAFPQVQSELARNVDPQEQAPQELQVMELFPVVDLAANDRGFVSGWAPETQLLPTDGDQSGSSDRGNP